MARLRLASWLVFALILALDAFVATPISLGVLYFAPLAYAALRISGWDALGMAGLGAVGRVVFGPGTDPLGLEALAFALPEGWQGPATAAVSFLGYAGTALLVLQVSRQRRRIDVLRGQTEVDPLTGVGNRRYLLRAMKAAGPNAAALAVDVDHFKRINDTHGHDGGDRVLEELARRLGEGLRQGDALARVGGEEFVVLLPARDAAEAERVGRRLWARVREHPFNVNGVPLQVTVSIGIATGAPGPELLVRADKMLYAAKASGRDRLQLDAA